MTSLFKKLNFKNHTSVVVLHSPASFETELKTMQNETVIIQNLKKVTAANFFICFVLSQQEIDESIEAIHKKLVGDAILWMCYPKGTSKKYKCDFNRDRGWAKLGALNLESVRMVAIDEDWSALRFRQVSYMKKITRKESFALSIDAKKRTTQKGI